MENDTVGGVSVSASVPGSAVRRVYSGAPWEQANGYCRALRTGNQVYVTGTVALEPDGTPHAPGDGERQAVRCFAIITTALRELGAEVSDLVRVRMFTTDMSQAAALGRVHRAWVGEHHPCLTLVGVNTLIDPAFVVEIEAEAVVGRSAEASAS